MAMKSGLASDSGFAHRTVPRPIGAAPAAPPPATSLALLQANAHGS